MLSCAAPVWTVLDEAQRTQVVTTLARVIAQTVLASRQLTAADDGEVDDE